MKRRLNSKLNLLNLVSTFSVLALTVLSSNFAKADANDELESLGSNQQIVRRANQLDAHTRVGVVQGRTVDRHWRFEIQGVYTPLNTGDSYLNTQDIGGEIDLHITPKFSLGVRYQKAFSSLTSDGQQQYQAANTARGNGSAYSVPQIDAPQSQLLAMADWYMFYGKMNFFDLSVVQFDVYSLAGAGQVQFASSNSPTWTAGGGIGFWLTNHLTSRFEVRYQTYTDQSYSGSRTLNTIAANLGFGILL